MFFVIFDLEILSYLMCINILNSNKPLKIGKGFYDMIKDNRSSNLDL